MPMFKVGDKVVRKNGTGNDALFKERLGGKIYCVVTSVSSGGYWLQLDGWCSNHETHPWYTLNFELYKEPEDELPPVPASVSYINSKCDPGNDQRLVVDKDNGDGEGLMYIGVIPRKGSNRAKVEIGINIDPDSALQLAHDLRRMAMDIKRKDK